MTPFSHFAVQLSGRVSGAWGSLSHVTSQSIATQVGVPLPAPWEPFSSAHRAVLEGALQSQPSHLYAVAAAIGMDATAVQTALKGHYDASAHQRAAFASERLRETFQQSFQVPGVLRQIERPQDEREALKLFQSLDATELNAVLWDLHQSGELHDLLNDFVSGILCWSNKRKLVRLLTQERLSDLTIPVRAAIVVAMQEGITASVMELGITQILEGTSGADLSRLKNVIDRHSPQDMLEMAYHDVDSKRLRRRILGHIQSEGASVRPDAPLVVSDIDDTVFVNWKDARYPKKTVYPGVHSFYRAVGRFEDNDYERRGPVFISARPEEGAGIVETYTVENLREIGFPSPTVLSGDLFHLLGASIADGKYNNYVPYDRLFPEFMKVLTGDNGQYDVDFERRVLTAYAETAIAGFIHDIGEIPVERPNAYDFEELTPPAGTRRIFFFDTYIGAALAAHEMTPPLITRADLHRIAREALEEFDLIAFESAMQQARVWNLIKRDYELVEKKHGKIEIVR